MQPTKTAAVSFASPSIAISDVGRPPQRLQPLIHTPSFRALGPPPKVPPSPITTTPANGKRALGPPPRVSPKTRCFSPDSPVGDKPSKTTTAAEVDSGVLSPSGKRDSRGHDGSLSFQGLPLRAQLPQTLPRDTATTYPHGRSPSLSRPRPPLIVNSLTGEDTAAEAFDGAGNATSPVPIGPAPFSSSSLSPKPPNVLETTPSARQLATRLKPLPSFTRDLLKARSNLHKRDRLNEISSNGGDHDDEDDGGDTKHSRVDRL